MTKRTKAGAQHDREDQGSIQQARVKHDNNIIGMAGWDFQV